MERASLFWVTVFCAFSGTAQVDSVHKESLNLTVYADAFYSFDFNQPEGNKRQYFQYNHNRHNEFNINHALIKFNVLGERYRANVALHAGTYVQDNYAAEEEYLRNVFEANVGLSLNKKQNLWIDAGIFASHIGFESALSIDNWTLTRSILADNSPYYLSGAKLTFTPDSSWEIGALICNGWQRIRRLEGNSLPGFGTQVKKVFSDKLLLNWSTYIGSEFPDSTRRMRYFNNFYLQTEFKKFGLIAGFDVGFQQFDKGSDEYELWYSPVLIGRYNLTDKFSLAVRAEYYSDPEQVMIAVPAPTHKEFEVFGASLNFDYQPVGRVKARLENRVFVATEDVFLLDNTYSELNYFIGASLALKLERGW